MLYSRKSKIRRTPRQNSPCGIGRLSRRLRVELMESRMMLSAAAPTIETAWPLISNESEGVGQISNVRQVWLTIPIGEGGYVPSDVFTSSGTVRLNYGRPIATVDSLLIQGSTFYDLDYNVGAADSELFDTGGLVPQVIDFATSQTGPALVVIPSRSLRADAPSEGGLISIRPILNPDNPSGEPKSGKSLVSATPANSMLHADIKAAELPAVENSLSQISGEWARAAVFEIAGGEPVHERLTMTGPQSKSVPASTLAPETQVAETSAFTNASRDANQLNARDTAASARASAAAAANNTPSPRSIGDTPLPAAIENGNPMFEAQLGIPLFDLVSRAGAIANPSASQSDEVVAAAFDEIGDGEAAIALPSSSSLRLNTWLSGTPLLLIFALERVTARRRGSSRRDASN